MHGYMLMVTVLSCITDAILALDKPILRGMAVAEYEGISNKTEQIHIQIDTISKPKPEALRLDTIHREDRARVRKGVSSSSVVSFKRRDRVPRRKNAYPSNWGTFSLYCKTGWLLQVLPNGVVNGTRNTNSPYALVQIQVLTPTLVRFKGVVSGRYVGINSKGRLISKKYPTKETLFQEEVLENSYRTFNSSVHPKVGTSSWYMGIRKNGSPKKASRTKVGEKCIQFLKLPIKSRRI